MNAILKPVYVAVSVVFEADLPVKLLVWGGKYELETKRFPVKHFWCNHWSLILYIADIVYCFAFRFNEIQQ